MGFFDKVKELAIKAKCMAGFHGGEFTYISGKPECHLEKICPDCKEHFTSFKHSLTDWEYLYSNNCDMRRECVLCSKKEFTTKHEYQKDRIDSSCRMIEKCQRCDHERIGPTKHEYQEDRIDSSCRVIAKCQRCDHEYIGSTKHNWEFSSHNGQVYRTCKRCGMNERKN